MRRENSVATPALYDGIAATPGPITDDPNYNVNSLNDPACLAQNFAAQAGNDNHDSDFWKLRNLIPGAAGSKVPLFLTQGLTENNTVADGLQQYLAQPHRLRARLARAVGARARQRDRRRHRHGSRWAAPAGSTRSCASTTASSRARRRRSSDPPIAVQTNDGKWRSEAQWPPADRRDYTTALRAGSYTDTAQSYSTGAADDPTATSGVWTISKPLPYDAAPLGLGHDGSVNVTTTAAERQPGGRRLRPRRERHRAAHHAPGPPGPQHRATPRSRSSCGRPTGSSRPVTASACA